MEIKVTEIHLTALQDHFSKPGVNLSGIAREAGMSVGHLESIVNGRRILSEKTYMKLLPVLKEHNFKEPKT